MSYCLSWGWMSKILRTDSTGKLMNETRGSKYNVYANSLKRGGGQIKVKLF